MIKQLRTKTFFSIHLLILVFLVTGCAQVKPWQRNVLAEPGMQLVSDEMHNYVDEHIYSSKEASKGGRGVGGGGCGCN